jgi:hypothetical protein
MFIMLAFALAACGYPTRNQPLTDPIHPRKGYRGGQILEGPLEKTLVIMTISGGGTRASALGYGAMRALSAIKLTDDNGSLLHAVDIVSSVSGGSVPAAYLALKGPDQMEDFKGAILTEDGIGRLLWRLLNPYGLLKLSTERTERIDQLISWFDDRLFDGATYGSLRSHEAENGWRRPYLIVNAADMAAETPFPFHQWRFDLLCSDLEQLPLAVAVAASAAFPVALSPITLVNYSEPGGGCMAQKKAIGGVWPPEWVKHIDNHPAQAGQAGTSIYVNASRVRRARTGNGYIDDDSGQMRRPYIHLLDGGIADNLGLAEPIRLLTTREIPPSLLSYIDRGMIDRVLVLVVNARSDPDNELNQSKATPGILSMLGSTTSSAIDNATFGRLQQLRETIRDLMKAAGSTRAAELAIDQALIDFDMIGDPQCRRRFRNIATSWTLKGVEVDALIGIAEALMWKDPGFREFVSQHQSMLEEPGWTATQAMALEQSVCDTLLGRGNR